jgi:hypothetical protein
VSARYRTQQEALLDALHSARKAGKRGEVVEVFLEGDILPIAFGRESLERIIDNSHRRTGRSDEVDDRGGQMTAQARATTKRQLGEHLHDVH